MEAGKQAKSTSELLSMFGLVVGCVLFGLGSLIVAHVDGVGGFAMAFWRLLISAGIFFALAVLFGQSFPTNKKAIAFAVASGVALGLDLALWHESIYAVGPGISTLLNSLQIFFLAFIAFVWFGERQTKMQLSSLVLATVGVALIASPEFAHNQAALWGFVSGIASGGFLALSMAYVRRTHETAKVAIFPMMTIVGMGGALSLLPMMLMWDWGQIMPRTMSEWGWIFVYGAVMQCLAWGLIGYSIPKLALSLTGLLLLTEPVAALLIDYFWLNKAINGTQWGGAFLVMFAIYLGSLKAKSH
ncbi:DMT family transporter [Moraxella nasibovis]|uniref:DMT family transporter n=1 Tax=Moraxella nasibovis TaxID=2904120 RepID=UPI00240EFE84|nr:DMT family transporter [Moraxella nasibovis]WFF38561.1 DMT family transporter [Moraxella nasibovis]